MKQFITLLLLVCAISAFGNPAIYPTTDYIGSGLMASTNGFMLASNINADASTHIVTNNDPTSLNLNANVALATNSPNGTPLNNLANLNFSSGLSPYPVYTNAYWLTNIPNLSLEQVDPTYFGLYTYQYFTNVQNGIKVFKKDSTHWLMVCTNGGTYEGSVLQASYNIDPTYASWVYDTELTVTQNVIPPGSAGFWEDSQLVLPVDLTGYCLTTNASITGNLSALDGTFSNLTGNLTGSMTATGGNVVTNNYSNNAFQTNQQPPSYLNASGDQGYKTGGALWQAEPIAPVILHVQPYPGSGHQLTNDAQVYNAISNVNLTGYRTNAQAAGLPLEIQLDVGSLLRDTNDYLFYRTNIYPDGITSFITYVHTNWGLVGFMRNVTWSFWHPTNVPGFWVDVNASGINSAVFQPLATYTNAQSFNMNYNDLMTLDKIQKDFWQFYQWKADEVVANDTSESLWDFEVIEKMCAYNCLYPTPAAFTSGIGYQYGNQTWNSPEYPFLITRTKPISFTAYESFGGEPNHNISDLYTEHNAMYYDAPATGWGSKIQGVSELRRFAYNWPLVEKANRGGIEEWNIADINDLNVTAIASWSPSFDGLSPTLSTSLLMNTTNVGYLFVHNDALQNSSKMFNYGTNQGSIWVKPLSDGGRAVLFANESNITWSVTANWGQLGFASNVLCSAQEMWSMGNATAGTLGTNYSSFSTNLASGTTCVVIFRPVQLGSSFAGNGGGLTNLSIGSFSSTTVSNNFYYGCGTATNVVVYAVPAGMTNTYEVGGFADVTALSVDVLNFQVLFTDENGNAQTIALDANITTTGFNPVSTQSIRCKGGTNITLKGNLVTGTGSITYDIGGFVKPIL